MNITEETPNVQKFEEFFAEYYKAELNKLAEEFPEKRSLQVDYSLLEKFDSDLADELIGNSYEVIQSAEQAVQNMQLLTAKGEAITPHVRFYNTPTEQQVLVRNLNSEHLGKFISIEGVVTKITEVKPKIKTAVFKCNYCGAIYKIPQDDFSGALKEPGVCRCEHKSYTMLAEQSEVIDHQTMEIQEPLEKVRGAEQTRKAVVLLEDDLTNFIIPGDKVQIFGTYRLVPPKNKKSIYNALIDSNNAIKLEREFEELELTEEDVKQIHELAKDEKLYDKIVASIAPSIYGHSEIKEAIALQLLGGTPGKIKPDGMKIRPDMHLLLIGDPGTGKCFSGNSRVLTAEGGVITAREYAEETLKREKRQKIEDGEYALINKNLVSMDLDCFTTPAKSNIVWKRTAPKMMYTVKTATGKEITITPTHRLFVCEDGFVKAKPVKLLKKGEFIATPRIVKTNGKAQNIKTFFTKSKANNAVRLKIPKKTSPEFWRFIALIIGDGYVHRSSKQNYVSFTNNEEKLTKEVAEYCKKIGLHPNSRRVKNAKEVYVSSIELASFLEKIGAGGKSKHKRIPHLLLKCSDEEIKAFLSAFSDAEATISSKEREICITTASKKMAEDLSHLFTRLGIITQTHSRKAKATNSKKPKQTTYYRIRISGEDVIKFWNEINFSVKSKKKKLEEMLMKEKMFNTNKDIIPNISKQLKLLRKELGLNQDECGVPKASYRHYEKGDRNPSRRTLKRITRAFEDKLLDNIKEYRQVIPLLQRLQYLSKSHLFWDRIKEVKKIRAKDAWVYDFQVPGNHNLIVNDIFVHNSQLLQYVSLLAPKGIYVSGKSSSAAGLTASAERDELSEGGWTLKAGALVLAAGGMAMIDEFDKMDDQDRASMHDAMESQEIHVAKAGIVATFKANASILAAANPKFGRFDTHELPANQFNISPTLLSRFDLIFPMMDEINEKRDSDLAEHILTSHFVSGLRAGESAFDEEAIKKAEEKVSPLIKPELLRKYIAYARKNYKPVLSQEAMDKIKNFYLELRRIGEQEGSIPITARYLEGIVRLAEASAKGRLSNVVEEQDAKRAIKLLKISLKSIGVDPETGRLDIDVIATGTSKSRIDRVKAIYRIIKRLNSEHGEASHEAIMEEARNQGIREEDIESILSQLKRNGDVYSPKYGVYKPTEER